VLKSRRKFIGFLLLIGVITFWVSLSMGSVSVSVKDILKIIIHRLPFLNNWIKSEPAPQKYELIILNLRLPRILLAMLVGSGLATAGAAMQGLFKNPLASPYVVGVSSGSSFGAALAILLLPGIFSVPLSAFFTGLVTIFLVYRISKSDSRVPVETLLLAGIAVGLFFSAITSLIMYISAQSVHHLVFWMMGGFGNANWDNVIAATPFIGFGIPAIYYFSRELNVMQLGEESATHLGVEIEKVKKILLILSSLITASAVAVSGVIGFVGLIIPHITRIIVGPDHRIVIPVSSLIGGIFLIWCDSLARTVIAPVELPVGIITSCFGAPFFIYLLKR